jgi:UDP-N-acetylglucosamine 2-epimerase (non-hydrolysing)
MQKKKIIVVAGARPNFMKIARLVDRLKKDRKVACLLVHTGQHYDFEMSEVFFQDLNIPKPDVFLNVGSASHAEQTAKIMTAFEGVLIAESPDLVVVAGDVNSTLACSLTAAKVHIKVAHIESGLRSFDRAMPEEVNRIVTDTLSDIHFVSEKSGVENLRHVGARKKGIHLVGSVMIDPLVSKTEVIDRSEILGKVGVEQQEYAVLTLHRPSNVDSAEALTEIYEILSAVSSKIKLVYPIHPRTRQRMIEHRVLEKFQALTELLMIEPLGYIDFMKLVKESRFVLTDSGSIQEETTYLHIPCLTMRENTERPSTIELGTNELVGRNKKVITKAVDRIMKGRWKRGRVPKYWDGKTTERILKVLAKI